MYKIEFFDSNFNFISAHIIDFPQISFDYLTLEAFTVSIAGKINAVKGNWLRISGEINFDGIVSNVKTDKNISEISIKPMLSLLDIEIFKEDFSDVALFIKNSIEQYIINSPDVLQNRPIYIINNAGTKNRPLEINDTQVNLLDVISSALVIHRIAVDCTLNLNQKKIELIISENTDCITLESRLNNVIEKDITIQDDYAAVNKIIIRKTLADKDSGTVSILDTVPFFLHTDGTVSREDKKRISPVFWTIDELEDSEDWEQKALEKAIQKLIPQKYSNEINLTYLNTDKIVNPLALSIGTAVNIIDDGKIYNSILTGKIISEDKTMLTFGILRTELTKKLIMERRQK